MKKKMIYWVLMLALLLLVLFYDKLGSIVVILGYFVGLTMGITNPPPKNVLDDVIVCEHNQHWRTPQEDGSVKKVCCKCNDELS